VAGTAVLGRLTPLRWLLAELVEDVRETPRVTSLVLDVPGWAGHRPGQHVDVRLTAEDGYQAQRSYSIAVPADGERLVLTVEKLEDGEVSPFLTEELRQGDRFELRGPIGGYFVWDGTADGPLHLVAGGSGVVPLMAMVRERERARVETRTRLLFSSRHYEEVIYREELDRLAASNRGFEVIHALTRSRPDGWMGYDRRIDDRIIGEVLEPLGSRARVYICGPTALVETAANAMLRLGLPPDRVRTERFGPTGT
jgi:ferredoxin-NADP reductase